MVAEKEGFVADGSVRTIVWCCSRQAGNKQQSTGLLHFIFKSRLPSEKEKPQPEG